MNTEMGHAIKTQLQSARYIEEKRLVQVKIGRKHFCTLRDGPGPVAGARGSLKHCLQELY